MKLVLVLLAVGTIAAPALFPEDAPDPKRRERMVAQQARAGSAMKSVVFPALVQFQGGAYVDEDGDNIGEYGFLGELAGRSPTARVAAGQLRFIAGDLASGDTADGYRFAVFLPDGAGGAIAEADVAAPRAGAPGAGVDARERSYLVYAWPATPDDGALVFALGHDGQVRAAPYAGEAPAWNAALAAGETFGGAFAWPVFVPDDEMRRAGDRLAKRRGRDQLLDNVARHVVELRRLAELWPAGIERLMEASGGSAENGILYVRPREPLAPDQPLFVADPALDDEGRAVVVFLAPDANGGQRPVRVLVPAERSAALWALAQEIAERPATRAEGSARDDWAAVRDALAPLAPLAAPASGGSGF